MQGMPARLYRSQRDKQIAGVAGGLADYFDIDPTLVRIGFVAAAFAGFGVVAYIVLWIAVPKEPIAAAMPGAPPTPTGRASSALRIAEERYARGEIGAEELARIRADLGWTP
jgi:phage shock protein C